MRANGAGRWGRLSAPAGGRAGTLHPQMLAGRVASPRRPPAPGRASGTLPASPLATSGRATSSLPVLPPGFPPGWGR